MNRRFFLAGAAAATLAIGTNRGLFAASDQRVSGEGFSLKKSNQEWRELLSEARYEVLFEEATERPWSSGTGWPSFYQPIDGATGTKTDYKLLFPRTEYHCSRCGGHQGHVFDDGPQPTGQRWCNNGLALEFVPAGEDLPALRA